MGLDGIDHGQKLPPGRHPFPQELVASNQRERLLSAAAAAFVEKGYGSLTVGDIVDRARVSRSTFYDLFDNKLDCVASAQRRAFERLDDRIAAACSSQVDWPHGVVAAVDAVLAYAASHPDETRLLLAASHAASDPALAREGIVVQERLTELLASGAHEYDPALTPDALTVQASLGAALSIVGICLTNEPVDALADLRGAVRSGLVQTVLAPYLGDQEAKRLAATPPS